MQILFENISIDYFEHTGSRFTKQRKIRFYRQNPVYSNAHWSDDIFSLKSNLRPISFCDSNSVIAWQFFYLRSIIFLSVYPNRKVNFWLDCSPVFVSLLNVLRMSAWSSLKAVRLHHIIMGCILILYVCLSRIIITKTFQWKTKMLRRIDLCRKENIIW